MEASSGTCTFLSRIARRTRDRLPMTQLSNTIESSTSAPESTRTPRPVIQVQGRSGRAQVHAGLVIRFDGSDVAPVGFLIERVARNMIGLKIVSVHISAPDEAGKNVAPEIVRAVRIRGIRVEFAHQQVGGKNVVAHGSVNPVGISGKRGR